MRKLLISLLLAGAAATPALADPGDSDREAARAERQQTREDRQQIREDRQQIREERQQTQVEPSVQADRPRFSGQGAEQRVTGAQSVARPGRFQQNGGPDNGQLESRRAPRAERAAGGAPDSVRNSRMQQRRDRVQNEDLRQPDRPLPGVMQTRTRVVGNVPREGTQPPLRVDNRRRDQTRWSTSWRNDRRYDWRNHRNRHRSLFHFGFYYDPFGWGYRPYSIGSRLWPSYYGSSYWLNNPWEYRLPYAPPGTRWIRYYDDALLVDTFSGQVVDVIHNFFW